MYKRTRKNPLLIYLSDDEKRILDEKVKISNAGNRSEFIRQLIVYGFVYYVDYRYLRKYNYQLGKIGTNINQVAKRINETRSIHQADIDDLQKEMEKIWQLQKSMLSEQPYKEQ